MYCGRCGSKISDNSVFCTVCGARLKAEAPPPTVNAPVKKKKTGCGTRILSVVLSIMIFGTIGNILDSILSPEPDYDYDNSVPEVTFRKPGDPEIVSGTDGVLSNTEPDPDLEPGELDGYILARAMNSGSCETLDGKVLLYVVFVDDKEAKWDSTSRSDAETKIMVEMRNILNESKRYGVSLDLYYEFKEATCKDVAGKDENGEWKEAAIRNLGFDSVDDAQEKLEKDGGYDAAPIVYVLNKKGRSYADYRYGSGYGGCESAVVYLDEYQAFDHEVYHLFGAQDFYYHDATLDAANKYLSNSIMVDSDNGEVDGFTAYIIGWTDELSDDAQKFVDATDHITEADLEQARENDQLTGYGTKKYGDGVYTGYMDFGVPNGEGEIEWNNGDFCEGTFVNGKLNGRGRYVWADGNTYEGDFVDGSMTGYGVFTWTNGDVYEGEVVDGARTGHGVYRWANGSFKEGYWDNGTFVS